MFLGVAAVVEKWSEGAFDARGLYAFHVVATVVSSASCVDGNEFQLTLSENPLVDFVELPPSASVVIVVIVCLRSSWRLAWKCYRLHGSSVLSGRVRCPSGRS